MAERKLCARDFAREIVHQVFFARGEAFDDSSFLTLERLAFKDLRNAAAKKVDPGLHIFFERVGLAAGKREQARPVCDFEIIDVAAVGRVLASRMEFAD